MKEENKINEAQTEIVEVVKKKKDKKKDKKKSERDKLEDYDPRGVQTLFRTLSRNHYNLLRQIDQKASVILTINSIIISLVLGLLYIAPDARQIEVLTEVRLMTAFCMVSMVLALFSMLPHRYMGRKYRDSSYNGILYAGNYSTKTLQEYRREMHRVMDNGKGLYDEMIDDLYFLGVFLDRKQRIVWFSVIIFIVGLIVAIGYAITNELWKVFT